MLARWRLETTQSQLTRDGSSKLSRVVQQSLSQLVPADAGRPHQDQGPPLIRLRIVESHLLIGGSLSSLGSAILERGVLSPPLVGLPGTEKGGGAGFSAGKFQNRKT